MNPGERQSHVTTTSTGSFSQSQISLTFITTALIFSSNLISYSHKVRGRGSIEGKNISKTKKAGARRVSSYLSDSSCLHSTPPCLSLSFLSAPPLLWGNRVDLYEIWSVSAKNKLAAQSVSCPTSLSLLCCNPPSCSPSLNCISASYLHFHITPLLFSSIFISRIHF